MDNLKPAKCYGPKRHSAKCRLGRPLCKWRRKEKGVICYCGVYHFPHRLKSGRCGNPEAMEIFVHGPIPNMDGVEFPFGANLRRYCK